MNDRHDPAKELARQLNRANRRRNKIRGIVMADMMTANATKPANSTNGLTFEGLMKMLKGEAA